MPEKADDDRFVITSRQPAHDVVLVEICGELDVDTVVQAKAYLAGATATRPHHLILDLSGVDFLTSSGLGLLLAARSGAEGIHGHLHLLGVAGNRAVEQPMTGVGFLDIFDIASDLDALLAELETGNSCG